LTKTRTFFVPKQKKPQHIAFKSTNKLLYIVVLTFGAEDEILNLYFFGIFQRVLKRFTPIFSFKNAKNHQKIKSRA